MGRSNYTKAEKGQKRPNYRKTESWKPCMSYGKASQRKKKVLERSSSENKIERKARFNR